ncbi:MAG TPA: PIG-L family deacetylase [Acidimicrobiales bacterium]|nr:PIG-L family deacetylase [Acidimicrobiales bacterium]
MDDPTWGLVAPELLRRIVVVSPHLDDAVLGTSHLLLRHRGSTVVTVFAGFPARYPDPPAPWDAAGGFRSGDDVVGARRQEDRRALELVDARPVWLDFVEHQYLPLSDRPTPEAVAPDLETAIRSAGATAVFLPMGLANPDHGTAHDAGMLVRRRMMSLAWFCYEDAGYAHLPGLLAWRVGKLFRAGIWPTPAVVPQQPDAERKRQAVWCYSSQIPPLEAEHALTPRLEANVGEQYWRLAPPPAGWEGLVDLP